MGIEAIYISNARTGRSQQKLRQKSFFDGLEQNREKDKTSGDTYYLHPSELEGNKSKFFNVEYCTACNMMNPVPSVSSSKVRLSEMYYGKDVFPMHPGSVTERSTRSTGTEDVSLQ